MSDLPPYLMTSDPGSFARMTIVERKPYLINQARRDYAYPAEIDAALQAFQTEIASQAVQPLHENTPDRDFWNAGWIDHRGKTWLEIPWYFAESFFYRRLLEAVRYFQPGEWQGVNPFQKQKDAQLDTAVKQFCASWEQFNTVEIGARFEALLHSDLWGNRADLSNYDLQVKAKSGLAARQERHLIIIDHTTAVYQKLSKGVKRVDFINDNAGMELLFDLALADYLLNERLVEQVHFHLKSQPYFVSDVMPADALAAMTLLKAEEPASTWALGYRLEMALQEGRLALDPDPFWSSYLMFRQMPNHLKNTLAQSDLVIFKGDANYRRILDDRHWPHTTRLEAVSAYLPFTFLTLRTLKSEVMVGLPADIVSEVALEDPQWLTNGRRGVIQLVHHIG